MSSTQDGPVKITRLIACVTSSGTPDQARTADGRWGFDLSEERPGWREAFRNPGPAAVFVAYVPGDLAACSAWVDSGQAAEVLAEIKISSDKED